MLLVTPVLLLLWLIKMSSLEKSHGYTLRREVPFSANAQLSISSGHLTGNGFPSTASVFHPQEQAKSQQEVCPVWLAVISQTPPSSRLAHVLWMLSGKGFTRSLVHSSLGACTLNIHSLERFVPLGNPFEDVCFIISSYICCCLVFFFYLEI